MAHIYIYIYIANILNFQRVVAAVLDCLEAISQWHLFMFGSTRRVREGGGRININESVATNQDFIPNRYIEVIDSS